MKDVKEKLKGTCVLNEKEEMGAEIVALYTEAGIENDEALVGDCIGEYYGERDGIIDNQVSKEYFQTILTLDQLREIVRGEKAFKEAPVEHQDQFVKANPEMSHSVEFKEGEMVEVKDISGLCLVVHVDGDMAWVIDENNRHYLPFLSDISKIDPDKELKEFAETIARKYVFGKHDALTDKQEVIDMTNDIVEAMKKVQSKK